MKRVLAHNQAGGHIEGVFIFAHMNVSVFERAWCYTPSRRLRVLSNGMRACRCLRSLAGRSQ
eukprot:12478706-Alexandrium_andersonii.AAC.1